MVDRLQPPPRMSGEPAVDVQVLRDYIWEMYQNLILEGGAVQTVDQPEDTVDPTTGIVTAFPIGYIFITVDDRNPVDYLGYGTWDAFGTGRVLVGVDTSDADFDTVEKESGAKDNTPSGTNSAPTFTGAALAGHTHAAGTLAVAAHAPTTQGVTAGADFNAVTAIDAHAVSGSTGSTSGGTPAGTVSAPTFTGDPVSVVQPSIAVFMWKRSA